MKAILFVALCLVGLAAASVPHLTASEVDFVFTKWATQHTRVYTSEAEKNYRRKVFAENLNIVRKHQADPKRTFEMAMNQFGDLTSEEFAATYTGYVPRNRDYARSKNLYVAPKNVKNPSSIDWAAKGKVTPIKDQGQCGSCWSFSATGSIESAYCIAAGVTCSSKTEVSEQQLVDCSQSFGNQGCEGGLMDQAFEYVISNKGLCTEQAYPYTAQDGTCQTNCSSFLTITGYTDVTSGSSSALESAVGNIGPVSVAVEADQSSFQFYSSGVLMASNCGTNLDHGVLVVGYGTYTDGTDYWKVKNSWGASWGANGYILLQKGDGISTCGVLSDPSYPTGVTKVGGKSHHRIAHH